MGTTARMTFVELLLTRTQSRKSWASKLTSNSADALGCRRFADIKGDVPTDIRAAFQSLLYMLFVTCRVTQLDRYNANPGNAVSPGKHALFHARNLRCGTCRTTCLFCLTTPAGLDR